MASYQVSEEECRQCVLAIKRTGINFLAIDFDMTLVDCHTQGKWNGSVDLLGSKVRPFFKMIVPMAMNQGVKVAIVTKSPQVKVIQAVLSEVFPDCGTYIPVRGHPSKGDFVWEYQGTGSRAGKQMHMASAAEELNLNEKENQARRDIRLNNEAVITRDTTLLIDDDYSNITGALNNSVRAIYWIPGKVQAMVEEFLALQ
jgi:hypothetical protein